MQPGECKVAERIMGFNWFRNHGCHIAFPVKDVGIDLFVIGGDRSKAIGIQVKESREYKSLRSEPRKSHSWHGVSEKDFRKPPSQRPDFYVFLYYKEQPSGHRMKFKEEYVVIPFSVIEKRAKDKKASSGGYDFYFSYDRGEKPPLVEYRDGIVDYTEYYDQWDLIKNALLIP